METDTSFADAIQEHMALRERNSSLDGEMPLTQYQPDDPFENHPLFKSEEQARLEETMENVESPAAATSVLPWPGQDDVVDTSLEDGVWTRSRDFDWGD